MGHALVAIATCNEQLVRLHVRGFESPRLVVAQAERTLESIVPHLLHPTNVRHEGSTCNVPTHVKVVEPFHKLRHPVQDLLGNPE